MLIMPLGLASLYTNTTGIYNTGLGHAALYANTTGNYNTSVGADSLHDNTTGSDNVGRKYYIITLPVIIILG